MEPLNGSKAATLISVLRRQGRSRSEHSLLDLLNQESQPLDRPQVEAISSYQADVGDDRAQLLIPGHGSIASFLFNLTMKRYRGVVGSRAKQIVAFTRMVKEDYLP
jgi:hypothetical protein